MASIAKAGSILFRFRPSDSRGGVSRKTLTRLAKYFGFTETQMVHYALRRLATEVLPSYEKDEGELTAAQIASLHKAEPQGRSKSVRSSLFD